VPDPGALNWLDPPPVAALAEARARLIAIGAVDSAGRPTPHGEAIAALPLAPALGHMLVTAGPLGLGGLAARLAVLIGERGLGGPSRDIDDRLRLWARDRSPRAEAARRLAERWARGNGGGTADPAPDAAAQLLALAYPDRVARRRGPVGAPWLMANGRAVTPMEGEPLASAPWIVVADAAGSAAGARLLSGAAIEATSVERLFASQIESRAIFAFDPASGGVTAETQRRLGAITLGRSPAERPNAAQLRDALVEGVRQHGLVLLPWGETSQALRARIGFARQHGMDSLPDLSDAGLIGSLADWLAPLLTGKRRLGDLGDAALAEALANTIDWGLRRQLDSFAPVQFATPAGSHHAIDYAAEAGPTAAMRVQTLFGLAAHPTVAGGRVPLTLALTSPAGRPIQVTTDLPRFWTGSWAEVRRELRGRYPKHPWPEDPASAVPTLRAKRPGQVE
jgi:ATP-dependent helicase HrpB